MKKERICIWSETYEGNWGTGCNETFVVTNGTPIENGMAYCCYCGAVLEQKDYKDEQDD